MRRTPILLVLALISFGGCWRSEDGKPRIASNLLALRPVNKLSSPTRNIRVQLFDSVYFYDPLERIVDGADFLRDETQVLEGTAEGGKVLFGVRVIFSRSGQEKFSNWTAANRGVTYGILVAGKLMDARVPMARIRQNFVIIRCQSREEAEEMQRLLFGAKRPT